MTKPGFSCHRRIFRTKKPSGLIAIVAFLHGDWYRQKIRYLVTPKPGFGPLPSVRSRLALAWTDSQNEGNSAKENWYGPRFHLSSPPYFFLDLLSARSPPAVF
jgi:hypothetical protein